MPTADGSTKLLSEVCDDLVKAKFVDLTRYRSQKYGACHLTESEAPKVAVALMPLCSRAFVKLNVMLAIDRDALFSPRNYVQVRCRLYVEEAPSSTFVRFLNDMDRLKGFGSETFERNISRISKVYALNRVAEIMPRNFHRGWSGTLLPHQTYDAMKGAEASSFRDASGIHSWADLLHRAGVA
ncbi:hypothetical protein [Paracoccus nototheniae]|uniref:Uncharacterized protein n=1 Tax=Paracoccus nototheniae TaxID=2489002 RepID=A0ABW4DY68_9RHOB|nr:hypothetical protein [Paracoccus nototheniae]